MHRLICICDPLNFRLSTITVDLVHNSVSWTISPHLWEVVMLLLCAEMQKSFYIVNLKTEQVHHLLELLSHIRKIGQSLNGVVLLYQLYIISYDSGFVLVWRFIKTILLVFTILWLNG